MTAFIVIFITLSLMGSALWIMHPKKSGNAWLYVCMPESLDLLFSLHQLDLPDKWDKSLNREKTIAYSFYRLKPVTSLPDKVWILPFEVWKYHSLMKDGGPVNYWPCLQSLEVRLKNMVPCLSG